MIERVLLYSVKSIVWTIWLIWDIAAGGAPVLCSSVLSCDTMAQQLRTQLLDPAR